MTRKTQINIDDIDAFVFDFDGVRTNNMVHLDQDGKSGLAVVVEMVWPLMWSEN